MQVVFFNVRPSDFAAYLSTIVSYRVQNRDITIVFSTRIRTYNRKSSAITTWPRPVVFFNVRPSDLAAFLRPIVSYLVQNREINVQWYPDNRPAGYRNTINCVSGIRPKIWPDIESCSSNALITGWLDIRPVSIPCQKYGRILVMSWYLAAGYRGTTVVFITGIWT